MKNFYGSNHSDYGEGEPINDVSQDMCKSGHRAGWDHSIFDAAGDPAAVLEQHMISAY